MKRFTKTDILAVLLLLLAAFLRFDELSLRPFHHDEGVNGFFLTKLVNAERAAYHARAFGDKITRTRRTVLANLISEFANK